MKVKTIILLSLILFINPIVSAQNSSKSSQSEIDILIQGQQKNLALTQYYRWFLAFERELNDIRINNHLNILSDDVSITTVGGPIKGKEGMVRFLNYVKSWKNAHQIENVIVEQNKDNTLSLNADIVYQNILPDLTKNTYKIHYATVLKKVENDLPIFTELTLLPTETLEDSTFKDAYVENRSKSLLHYWMHVMDNLQGNQDAFKEIIASDFKLSLPANNITNYNQLETWIKTIQNQIKVSLHSFKNFKATTNSDNTINVSVDIEWKGVNIKGEKMVAEIHHDWTLENNLDERFARIKEIQTKVTKPFQVVDSFITKMQ